MTVAAVIVAGGSGLRAGGERPKQYQLIGGRPVIWWTCRVFLAHPAVDIVQPVIGEGHEAMFAEATKGLDLPLAVIGGSTRQDSCRIGIEAVARHKPSKVLIHDAARPFVSAGLIDNVISWLDRFPAAIPGMPVAETLKFAPGGMVSRTVDRASIWTAQTPQGFTYDGILAAYRKAEAEQTQGLTDDASVAEHAGIAISMIMGELENRKLTTADDIVIANRDMTVRQIAERPDVRVGQGIDVHTFDEGDAVILCGVSIPHTQRLKGHSDADVAMHALTDAILGTVGEGDIGTHFPPSDQRWKGAASRIFLEKAVELLEARHGIIANADITILAEAPKIAPHVPAMRAYMAPLLHIDPSRIAVKATTMEKLGAIGRKEGIMAYATVTVRLP
ncbi:MAG: bifunctional 2-C-methyl-D-erythritol 4-phosphate cytidylyltransferase/2-C-methyl-D-erythritol 2,4-cyclodiphosphate synthase [Aestuariivirga sp.]|uniref:bifunctional 2-C-methyl-D-erythritol 4-phosphate cytidylyltransferase/2-C-methyl-D-erythritol 2,4-cyclodiphosphate synthase n=1 Tax=Aestuariivirga sp. TaxID=2650926 RepID=UPI0025C708E3|nr:bifunctional 2-C-methyl-D-erythritol 4-phosphate cytidylyltransferase/2-C-methyl-D-erythritol 2,4-cyclodiphosphate synthase [Aestuariivirga sp.]MCA3560931.1 bifunctional 2-C-methyl-D-erythritol 4-phosphate cytidylyltransferase/2-C-methyl-D-erythritol 2,4-cyclodiphosphate synthase [Aestuariivirga sp.]